MATKKQQGLSKKQQQELTRAAANTYNSLSDNGKKGVWVVVIIAVIAFAVWYFAFGGKATIDNLTGNASSTSNITAVTAASVSAEVGPETSGGYVPSAWNKETAPNYYLVEGPAVVTYDVTEPGEIKYGGIDRLGRSTWSAGVITNDVVEESSGWRCEFDADADKISGWGHNAEADVPKADGSTTRSWFYNRSHLLADSLGGYRHVYKADGSIDQDASKSERQNLVTGTRTQNVGLGDGKGGMAYFESMARDYLKNHPSGKLYYAATAAYVNDELVPRSVFVDMKSADGVIDIHGEVFNTMDGYDIDYATGEFSKK